MNVRELFLWIKNEQDFPVKEAWENSIFQELSKDRQWADWDSFSDVEKKRIDKMLAYPDPRPMDFDVTLEAWILRISNWGKIKITHKNPEDGINRTMSTHEFLYYLDDQDRNAAYGLFNVEVPKIELVRYYREFWSIYGKKVTEEILVAIDLKPSLKKALKKVRGLKGLLGKFGF